MVSHMCFWRHVRSFGRKKMWSYVLSRKSGSCYLCAIIGNIHFITCFCYFSEPWKFILGSYFLWTHLIGFLHVDWRIGMSDILNKQSAQERPLWETSLPQVGCENDRNDGCKVFLYTHFSFSSERLLLHWKMWKDLFWWATRRRTW